MILDEDDSVAMMSPWSTTEPCLWGMGGDAMTCSFSWR